MLALVKANLTRERCVFGFAVLDLDKDAYFR
jgi:hypothetical protein